MFGEMAEHWRIDRLNCTPPRFPWQHCPLNRNYIPSLLHQVHPVERIFNCPYQTEHQQSRTQRPVAERRLDNVRHTSPLIPVQKPWIALFERCSSYEISRFVIEQSIVGPDALLSVTIDHDERTDAVRSSLHTPTKQGQECVALPSSIDATIAPLLPCPRRFQATAIQSLHQRRLAKSSSSRSSLI